MWTTCFQGGFSNAWDIKSQKIACSKTCYMFAAFNKFKLYLIYKARKNVFTVPLFIHRFHV